MKTRNTVIASIAVASALALSACGGAASSSTDAKLTLAVSAEPLSLDPSASANGNASAWFVDLTYQSILNLDEEGAVAPGLAESWEFVDDDFTQLRVTLRDGVKFADGTEITPEAVVQSLEHFKEGSGPTVQNFSGVTAEAEDDRSIIYTSEESNPLLPMLLTPKYMGGATINPVGLETPEQLAAVPQGAGPYVLDSSRSVDGDRYIFTPNENYYDQDSVKFDEITIRVIPNITSQVQALKSGQIDVMVGDTSIMSQVEGVEDVTYIDNPVMWNGLMLLDRDGTLDPALADVRVRQALNYAIDREAITEAAYGEFGSPESQPTTPGEPSLGYDESLTDYYTYDLDKAKELMAEAGYEDGFDLAIAYKGYQSGSERMVQALAAQLSEINVNVTLDPGSNTGDWVSKFVTLEYGAIQQDSSGKPLLIQVPGSWLPGGTLNPFSVDDSKVSEAFAQLQQAGDDENGDAAKALTRALVEEALNVPVSLANEIIIYDESAVDNVRYLGETSKLAFIYDWDPADS